LDNDQYKELFIDEAKEHIDKLTKCLLTLEKDPQNKDVVNALFRSAHTLKGSSGMMGFKDFQELTHAMEDIFDEMRKGNAPTCDLISVLLECVDELSSRLQNIQKDIEGEIQVATLKEKLKGAVKFQPAVAEVKTVRFSSAPESMLENKTIEFDEEEKDAVRKAENSGKDCYIVNLSFSKDCAFKNLRADMVLEKVAEVAEVIKTIPNLKDIEEEKLSEGFTIAVTSTFDRKAVEKCVQQVLEVEQVSVVPFDANVLHRKEASPIPRPEKDYLVTENNEKVTKVLEDVQSAQTVRVKFDQLDMLMNTVGELVINKIALLEVTADSRNKGLKSITENIDRLTADLQDLVMQVRMVPVSQIFDRFPRLVRDLSLKKGKKIELVMEGKDIEVDRTVLDEIGEPLIHLLRNSIDHGVEMPSERENAKKDTTGKIRLSAQRNGDRVIIEVEDNGAGIDPEKIKKSAIKKGFATEAELEKMSSDQLVNMIYLPGFSTAKEVTDTSGRGVGMDVVKTKISAIG
jgi:two-component system chemotaxis sensor kinase CheA